MKKNLLLIAVLVFSIQFVSAQKADTSNILSPQASYDFYMKRHATYKTIGWVMFVPGVTMTIIGLSEISIRGLGDAFASLGGGNSTNYNNHRGEALAYVGGGLVLGSITSFIIAGHNKRKASLALKNGSMVTGPGARGNLNYTAVCLKIQF